ALTSPGHFAGMVVPFGCFLAVATRGGLMKIARTLGLFVLAVAGAQVFRVFGEEMGVGCLAFSGQLNWYYFMLRAAGPGTRRGPLEGSGNREPNGDEPDYTGVRCSGQYPPWPFSASGRRYDGPARL